MSFKDPKDGFSYQSYETYVMVSEATWDKAELNDLDGLAAILEAQNQAWKLYKLIGNCDVSDKLRFEMFEAWFEMNDYLWVVRREINKMEES